MNRTNLKGELTMSRLTDNAIRVAFAAAAIAWTLISLQLFSILSRPGGRSTPRSRA